ncbi:MAG: uroporphyrinogen decarboxylase family protein [bacterium]
MKKMTSRERVRAAAELRPVDRIPVMLWLEPHTLMKIANEVVRPRRMWERRFFRGLGRLQKTLPTEDLRNAVPLTAFLVQADFQRELGADIVDFAWGFLPLWLKGIRVEGRKFFLTDIYGVERGMGGLYLEATGYPCKTPEELERYRFPDLSHPIHYAHIRLYRMLHPDAAIVCWCPGVQDWSQQWMGMQNLYMWCAEHPEIIGDFFMRMAEHSLQIIRGALRAGADIILIGDDYGTQKNLFMSKPMWERLTYPCLKLQCEGIHRSGGLALLHSCGSIAPLLDRIVDAGVDMLHPFQPVGDNDLAAAKAEFGDRLCFVTGIDVQRLPTMAPGEVRESILENVRIAAPGSGFVLCPTNFVQEDTPAENLKAMFDTIKEVQNSRF